MKVLLCASNILKNWQGGNGHFIDRVCPYRLLTTSNYSEQLETEVNSEPQIQALLTSAFLLLCSINWEICENKLFRQLIGDQYFVILTLVVILAFCFGFFFSCFTRETFFDAILICYISSVGGGISSRLLSFGLNWEGEDLRPLGISFLIVYSLNHD